MEAIFVSEEELKNDIKIVEKYATEKISKCNKSPLNEIAFKYNKKNPLRQEEWTFNGIVNKLNITNMELPSRLKNGLKAYNNTPTNEDFISFYENYFEKHDKGKIQDNYIAEDISTTLRVEGMRSKVVSNNIVIIELGTPSEELYHRIAFIPGEQDINLFTHYKLDKLQLNQLVTDYKSTFETDKSFSKDNKNSSEDLYRFDHSVKIETFREGLDKIRTFGNDLIEYNPRD